jgi:archaellum component FlaG (FlaF/FlaG flagellin family)
VTAVSAGTGATGCSASARSVNVSTLSGLTSALSNAQPGDCITVAAGRYTLGTRLTIAKSGTAASPIVIQGAGSSTILDANQNQVFLDGSYVRVRKVRLTNLPFTGLWLRGAQYSVIDSVELDHSQQELLALKYGSSHNTISNSYLHHSGMSGGTPGEGIYVGQSHTTELHVANKILNNRFDHIWTESVDMKPGADSTLVQGNVIDGSGSHFYDNNAVSLIAGQNSKSRIVGNTLSYGAPHGIVFFSGTTGNVIQGNTIHLYNLHSFTGPIGARIPSGGGTVKCDNVVDDIPSGGKAYNVTCTP